MKLRRPSKVLIWYVLWLPNEPDYVLIIKYRLWDLSDLNREPTGSRLCGFYHSVDYVFILSDNSSSFTVYKYLRSWMLMR